MNESTQQNVRVKILSSYAPDSACCVDNNMDSELGAFCMEVTMARNDSRAQAMYELYQQGKSTRDVGEVFNCCHAVVLKMFKRRGWQRRPRPRTRQDVVMSSGYAHVFVGEGHHLAGRGCRYARLHRVVAEQILGRRLTANERVHHVDGNRTNNDPTNLLVVTPAQHTRLHYPDIYAKRQAKWWKGFTGPPLDHLHVWRPSDLADIEAVLR